MAVDIHANFQCIPYIIHLQTYERKCVYMHTFPEKYHRSRLNNFLIIILLKYNCKDKYNNINTYICKMKNNKLN